MFLNRLLITIALLLPIVSYGDDNSSKYYFFWLNDELAADITIGDSNCEAGKIYDDSMKALGRMVYIEDPNGSGVACFVEMYSEKESRINFIMLLTKSYCMAGEPCEAGFSVQKKSPDTLSIKGELKFPDYDKNKSAVYQLMKVNT